MNLKYQHLTETSSEWLKISRLSS